MNNSYRILCETTPFVVPPPNGAALPGSRDTGDGAITKKQRKNYKSHQTITIYARYIAGGGPIKQQ